MKSLLKIIFFTVAVYSCMSHAKKHKYNIDRLHYSYHTLIKYCKELYQSDKVTMIGTEEIEPGLHGSAYANCIGDKDARQMKCCMQVDEAYWTINGNSCLGKNQPEWHRCGPHSPVQ